MQTNDKLYQGMELPRKTSDRPLNAEIIRQTRKKVMDGKDVLVGEHRRSSIFAGYHILHQLVILKDTMEGPMFGRKVSILFTMIVKYLIHCWDNFEQNVRMLARC